MEWVSSSEKCVATYKWERIDFDDQNWWWVASHKMISHFQTVRREILVWLSDPKELRYRVRCEKTWEVLMICLTDMEFVPATQTIN